MRRLIVVAALVAVLGSVPLSGQMRGGRVGASFGRGFSSHNFGFARGGFGVSRSGFGFNRGAFAFGRGSRFFFNQGRFNRGPFFFGRRRALFGGSFYWGPAYYPSYYAYPYAEVETAPAPTYYPDEYYEQGTLRQDIDVLTGKVDHLQRDVESRMAVPRPPARHETAVRQSTMLVFKDQHLQEVQNYAVVGETLWILDEKKASKVPLADLDVDATTRLNEDRGVEFELPRN